MTMPLTKLSLRSLCCGLGTAPNNSRTTGSEMCGSSDQGVKALVRFAELRFVRSNLESAYVDTASGKQWADKEGILGTEIRGVPLAEILARRRLEIGAGNRALKSPPPAGILPRPGEARQGPPPPASLRQPGGASFPGSRPRRGRVRGLTA